MTRCAYCGQSECQRGANVMETVVFCDECGKRGVPHVARYSRHTGNPIYHFHCPDPHPAGGERKGGPCETCKHSIGMWSERFCERPLQFGSDFVQNCKAFGGGCYAWEPLAPRSEGA